jgi:hypothetical protein
MAAHDAELDALRERAARLKPIPLPLHGQCLRDAVAFCLRRDPWELPLRWSGEEPYDWALEVGARFGVTIEHAGVDELPPPGNEVWVALIPAGDVNHALPMRGTTPVLVNDWSDYPNPMNNLLGGLLVRPA